MEGKDGRRIAGKGESEHEEAKKELDAVKQLLDTITHLLLRTRARPRDFGREEEGN